MVNGDRRRRKQRTIHRATIFFFRRLFYRLSPLTASTSPSPGPGSHPVPFPACHPVARAYTPSSPISAVRRHRGPSNGTLWIFVTLVGSFCSFRFFFLEDSLMTDDVPLTGSKHERNPRKVLFDPLEEDTAQGKIPEEALTSRIILRFSTISSKRLVASWPLFGHDEHLVPRVAQAQVHERGSRCPAREPFII